MKCARPWAASLPREAPADADVIVPVPDSGVPAALGYSQQSGIPFDLGIIRNHYVGRTFIEPTQQIRQLGVRLKHNANRAVVSGKRIVLVDDSIVRGTTSTKIVQMMRDAGAKEVHFRIASPPITHPDYYGIDTPDRDKLLAATHTLEEMRQFIGADSLAFLSVEGIYRSMGYEIPRSAASAIHRPLLHRRISDSADRHGRRRPHPAAIVIAGRGKLNLAGMNAPAQKPRSYTALLPGDPAPWFHQRSLGNPNYAFSSVAGRYVVMCFYGSAAEPLGRAALDAVIANRTIFDDSSFCFFGVSSDPQDAAEGRITEMLPGHPLFPRLRSDDRASMRRGTARHVRRRTAHSPAPLLAGA